MRLISSAVAVIVLTACGTRKLDVSAQEAYPPTFEAIRQRILIPRCSVCHSKIVSYAGIMNDLVVAGEPEKSKLFEEINSGGMPKDRGKLSDEEISAVKTWIVNGAKP